MQTIYKYQFPIVDEFSLHLPFNANLLTCQVQNEVPAIWAVVSTEAKTEERFFKMYGTGHELPELFLSTHNYIGTIQLAKGALVFHVFEIVN